MARPWPDALPVRGGIHAGESLEDQPRVARRVDGGAEAPSISSTRIGVTLELAPGAAAPGPPATARGATRPRPRASPGSRRSRPWA